MVVNEAMVAVLFMALTGGLIWRGWCHKRAAQVLAEAVKAQEKRNYRRGVRQTRQITLRAYDKASGEVQGVENILKKILKEVDPPKKKKGPKAWLKG